MKSILMIGAAATVLTGSLAFAENAETPKIDQRQANQERRIDQGIASGQLNQKETARLEGEQNKINRMEDKAKADGVVTKQERTRIRHKQNQASHHIAREKHDLQGKRHQ